MTDKILEALELGLENSRGLQIYLTHDASNQDACEVAWSDIERIEVAIEFYKAQKPVSFEVRPMGGDLWSKINMAHAGYYKTLSDYEIRGLYELPAIRSEQNTSDVLCEVRARLRSAPRRQFECAPNIYSSWLCQDSVLDILDEAILKSEQNLNKVQK